MAGLQRFRSPRLSGVRPRWGVDFRRFPTSESRPVTGKKARRIQGLAVKVWSDDPVNVRTSLLSKLHGLGYGREADDARRPLRFVKGPRRIQVRASQSLLKDSVTVGARFAPPAPARTVNGILVALEKSFPLGRVSIAEASETAARKEKGRSRRAARSPART